MTTPPEKAKPRIATVSLAGCFGCHMSLLDMDERLFDLVAQVQFDRSPLTDIKTIGACDVGLIEGGIANEENLHVLRNFREQCHILVAVGACAINGGVPAMRNSYTALECLEESYLDGIGLMDAQIPNDAEIPPLLDKVYPLHEVVKIDAFLPGCPPSADAIWACIEELLQQTPVHLSRIMIHYD